MISTLASRWSLFYFLTYSEYSMINKLFAVTGLSLVLCCPAVTRADIFEWELTTLTL